MIAKSESMTNISHVFSQFDTRGTFGCAQPLGEGLINDTYLVRTAERCCCDYVLQRINTGIFSNVDMLQNNIMAVTRHIRHKLEAAGEHDIDRKVLTCVGLKNSDKTYYYDEVSGEYWRMTVFIPGADSFNVVNLALSRDAGMAFGHFQEMLVDIQDTLYETIPNFHNIEFRLGQLREAVEEDKTGRAKDVRCELDAIEMRAAEMTISEQLHRDGKLPKRICHCDTKVNNVLFDNNGKVLCVIDLDTVMPSYVFSDYGDFLRTAANTGAEDDRNLDNVSFNMDIFHAFTEGYLKSAASFLLPVETDNLPHAAALFPYMQAVRFMTDYINGDTYYKTQYPQHNLVRTRAQLKLLTDVELHMPEMHDFITGVLIC